MNLTLKDVTNSEGALERLMSNKFPIKLSYKLSRVLTNVQRELKHFNKAKLELCQRLGTETQSDYWEVTNENLKEFNKEMESLLEIPVEAWGEQVKMSELANIAISPMDLVVLDWLIDFEDEETTVKEEAKAAEA